PERKPEERARAALDRFAEAPRIEFFAPRLERRSNVHERRDLSQPRLCFVHGALHGDGIRKLARDALVLQPLVARQLAEPFIGGASAGPDHTHALTRPRELD